MTFAQPIPRTSPRPGVAARPVVFLLVAAAAAAASGAWMVRCLSETGADAPAAPAGAAGEKGAPAPLRPGPFHDWPRGQKPALALVLSGQTYGYIQPCGCSRPQLGGLERRYNFIEELQKEKGWPVVALDLGDVANRKGLHKQSLLKYTLSMRAMKEMGYAAVGVGPQEFGMPLFDALASYSLQPGNERPRVLAGNLQDREKEYPGPDGASMVGVWEVIARPGARVGVVGVVGPSVAKEVQNKINANLVFQNNAQVITQALGAMAAQKPEVRVLLYQGDQEEAKLAAEHFQQFHVVLCRSEEEEPPAFPTYVGGDGQPRRMVVTVGHKGRHVGVVGFFPNRTGGYDLRYHLVSLGEEYETAPGAVAAHPILQQLEKYAAQVKRENFLQQYPKVPHPLQVKHPDQKVHFVGSDKCAACHVAETQVWKNSKHSHAYEALSKIATKPSLRNFDGECIVCHTVGFKYQTGYVNEELTANLKHVGCENCHGPGSLHVAQPMNKQFALEMSPWKVQPNDRMPDVAKLLERQPLTAAEQRVLNRVDAVCQGCHDPDNDPHFRIEDKKYWPQIVHTGLGAPKK